jgi:hypothetical protein
MQGETEKYVGNYEGKLHMKKLHKIPNAHRKWYYLIGSLGQSVKMGNDIFLLK